MSAETWIGIQAANEALPSCLPGAATSELTRDVRRSSCKYWKWEREQGKETPKAYGRRIVVCLLEVFLVPSLLYPEVMKCLFFQQCHSVKKSKNTYSCCDIICWWKPCDCFERPGVSSQIRLISVVWTVTRITKHLPCIATLDMMKNDP